MKKKFTLKMLTTALFLALGVSGLAGCNPTTDPTGPTDPSVNPSTEPSVEPSVDPVVVNGVTITDSEGEEPNTDVFDNQDIQLKANVDVSNSSDKADTKVTWSVDKPEVATVTSTGLVTIDPIKSESETLVVTATSKVDPTKSASVEFNIKHSVINLLNSKPMNMDLEDYYENGVIENGDHTQDTALVYADVYDTRWYVEAEIRVMSLDPNDAYPKFGLLTGTSKYGAWQNGEDEFAMYYVDLAQASTNNWTSVNFVVGNEEHNDWMWGSQLGGAALTEKIELTKKFKLGLMRDGTDYYYYYGNSSNDYATYKCYKHVVWEGVPADTPSYAWVGGFRAATKVGGFKALVGDAVDAMYEDLTTFDVENKDVTLFLNETSKINIVTPVSNYKPSDFVFTSENPDVATVSSTGVITAGSARGTTRISVKYKDTLEVFVNVTVTDDTKFSVILDGKMDDAIWTDEVKSHPYTFSRKNLDVNITLYASRNSRGIYLYANYQAAETFISGNWWEDDNMEFRFNGIDGQLKNKEEVENNTGNPTQYWISQFNGGQSNFTAEYISGDKYDEATGMYTIVFEMFASYEYLGVTEDALIGFSMGANPGGRYWWNNDCWNTYDFYATNKITDKGIVRYYDETGCDHVYGGWNVVTQASCANPGEEERFCRLCNHKDTKTTPQGDHSYTGAITANSTGSCMGTQACVGGCGNTKPVVMDSYTAHEAWDETAGECTACHNRVNVNYEFNKFDVGGWGDPATQWHFIANKLVGEYDVEIKYTAKVNGANDWWKGVLPIVQDGDYGNGSVFVTRFDWWGWVDQRDSSISLCNMTGDHNKGEGVVEAPEWMPAAGENWYSTWTDGAAVDLHFKKTATEIINTWTVTPLGGPNAGTVWSGYAKIANPVLTTSINLAIAAEFTQVNLTAVYYHLANF